MKIALLGDTHFGARNDSLLFHSYFEKFFSECMFPYMEQHNIKHLIQLGDLFDRRKYVNYLTLTRAQQYFFEPLKRQGVLTRVLIGNHDTFYRNTNSVNSPSLLLKEYDNLIIYTEPVDIEIDGFPFLIVPWINPENEEHALLALEHSPADTVIGHFEIKGFEMSRGMPSHIGVDADIFARFEHVWSGHFHHKHQRGNISYLGTPYEMTWADHDDPRGFHVFDTETRELEFIQNPHKMFYKMWYDDRDKEMSEIVEQDFSELKDKTIKVIVTHKDNPYWFDLLIDKLEKAGIADLQVVDDHLNLNLKDDTEIVEAAEDTLTLLNRHITQSKIDCDKTRLDFLIKDLYSEALTLE